MDFNTYNFGIAHHFSEKALTKNKQSENHHVGNPRNVSTSMFNHTGCLRLCFCAALSSVSLQICGEQSGRAVACYKTELITIVHDQPEVQGFKPSLRYSLLSHGRMAF